MPVVVIKMSDVDHCLSCNQFIGKGNDPAVCSKKQCMTNYEFESAFNKFAKEQAMNTNHWQAILDKWDNYQIAADKTAVYPKESLVYPVLGLVGEAGEFLEALGVAAPNTNWKTDVVKEAGDVLWYSAAICTSLGVKFSSCHPANRRDTAGGHRGTNVLMTASKIAEAYKKAIRSGLPVPDPKLVVTLLTDVMVSVDMLLGYLGMVSILEVMDINIEKLSTRAATGTLKSR